MLGSTLESITIALERIIATFYTSASKLLDLTRGTNLDVDLPSDAAIDLEQSLFVNNELATSFVIGLLIHLE